MRDSKQKQPETGSCEREAVRSREPLTWSFGPGPAHRGSLTVFAVRREKGPSPPGSRPKPEGGWSGEECLYCPLMTQDLGSDS